MTVARERRTFLLGGRRVAVSDLLENGLLVPGDVLTFRRPRVGKTHTAIVESRGSLRVGGRSFVTPSKAACTAAGVTQIDGWTAWVTDEGRSLHSLRAELLDTIADDAVSSDSAADRAPSAAGADDADPFGDSDADESATAMLPRHIFLKEARRLAENDVPLVVPVRALLARWGGRARGMQLSSRIRVDLDNHGLVSQPDFMRVSLDDEVTLVAVEPDAAAVETDEPVVIVDDAPPAEAVSTSFDLAPAEQPAIGLTLGNLMSVDRPALVSVSPNATVAEALTLMLVHDYSQLPVIDGAAGCTGAVTWKSIAYAQLKDPAASLVDATVKATVRSYSEDLHHLLPLLQADDFVVVTNHRNAVTGIVTTSDVAGLYGERTRPFLLIGELDQELRQLMTTIDLDTIRAICGKVGTKPKSYDSMTMNHYITVMRDADCWAAFGWPLDRTAFVAQLDSLRRIRNDVMHFNPDGVPGDTISKLRHVLALIRDFATPGTAS